MTTLGNSSNESSQITLSVPLKRDGTGYQLLPASCEYETSGNASWKIAVSSVDNNACVTLHCRRTLASDTLQAVYSVGLAILVKGDDNWKITHAYSKQGHVIFSGPTLETTATFNLNVEEFFNSSDYLLTFVRMHITILNPLAEDMSVKIYEDAFSTVDKAQLFSESSPFQSDCVIYFKDGKEVHVNKNLLSLDSDVWKHTFVYYEEYSLLDVDYDQFLDFLCVIYPTAHPITVKNVETLSKFAHDFKMTELLKRCDIFLMANSTKFGKNKLLLFAQNYNLERLQSQCISKYNSVEDIKAITTEPEYADLHDRTKRMLLDKILGISPSSLSEAPMPENRVLSGIVTNEARASQILDKLASLSSCRSDIVLVVGNAKIPAHKHLLSYFSEFFDKMVQSRENEVTLEEVRYEEIVELLSVTYPADYAINETNIATIVKLADRFVMPIILGRCKQELKNSDKIKGALKLWLAQRYNFTDLQEEFARKCNSIDDVKKLKDESEFELLDDHTRALILESITLNEPLNEMLTEMQIWSNWSPNQS